MWQKSIQAIAEELDLSTINLDGTHTPAKKGGESVEYQYRKRTKTSNILPMVDAQGAIVATTGIIVGNHHDAFNLKPNLQRAFKKMKRLGLDLQGTYFNADAAFDTRDARKICFNHGLIPNIALNSRNQKRTKRGRKRLFDDVIYKQRFPLEHVFAWIDKFRALRVRDDRLDSHFLGAHYIVFTMINLRHLLANKFK